MHTTAVDLLEYGRDTRDPGSERHETFSANGCFTGVFLNLARPPETMSDAIFRIPES